MMKNILNMPTIGFKIESIPYVAETLTSDNYKYSINSDIKISPDIESYSQKLCIGDFSKQPSISGKRLCAVNFSIDLYTMSNTSIAPSYFDILSACGWKQIDSDEGINISPDSLQNRVPATIEVCFPDETAEPKQMVYLIGGAMGSVKLSGSAGTAIKAEFTFVGKLVKIFTRNNIDMIIPSGFDTGTIPVLIGSSFKLFGIDTSIENFEINSNETFNLFSDITEKSGYSGARITDRYSHGNITVFDGVDMPPNRFIDIVEPYRIFVEQNEQCIFLTANHEYSVDSSALLYQIDLSYVLTSKNNYSKIFTSESNIAVFDIDANTEINRYVFLNTTKTKLIIYFTASASLSIDRHFVICFSNLINRANNTALFTNAFYYRYMPLNEFTHSSTTKELITNTDFNVVSPASVGNDAGFGMCAANTGSGQGRIEMGSYIDNQNLAIELLILVRSVTSSPRVFDNIGSCILACSSKSILSFTNNASTYINFSILPDKMNHVIIIRRSTGLTDIYVNGIKVVNAQSAGTPSSTSSMGYLTNTNAFSWGRPFDGYVDEFSLSTTFPNANKIYSRSVMLLHPDLFWKVKYRPYFYLNSGNVHLYSDLISITEVDETLNRYNIEFPNGITIRQNKIYENYFQQDAVGTEPIGFINTWNTEYYTTYIISGGVYSNKAYRGDYGIIGGNKRCASYIEQLGTSVVNCEILSLCRIVNNLDYYGCRLHVRGGGAIGSEKCYLSFFDTYSGIVGIWYYNGTASYILNSSTKTIYAGLWYFHRFRAVDASLKMKIWEYNSIEPDDWDVITSDSNLIDGWIGVGSSSGENRIHDYCYIGVTTGNNPETVPIPRGI